MKKVYLVLTDTGTTFSKMIRKHTGDKYNHISISLREDLSEMYSFGRRNAYIFFYGGFVIEKPRHGTFKRFNKTSALVFELPVEDDAYAIIEDMIQHFISERKRFGYNIRGIFKARKNVNYQGSFRRFYCSQFVSHLLVCARVIPEDFFGGVPTPTKFSMIPSLKPLYEGLLWDYAPPTE